MVGGFVGILLGCLAMALNDGIITCKTVCLAHGRAAWAAFFDGARDIAGVLVVVAGAGAIIRTGQVSLHSEEVLAAMIVTSALGTFYWTKAASRWFPQEAGDGS